MAARIDPFVDVLLREKGDQLYLLPDEPVTMVKDGKPRKVSRQPLTDQHIYALLSLPTSPRPSTREPSGHWASCSRSSCSPPPRICICAWGSRPFSGRTGR